MFFPDNCSNIYLQKLIDLSGKDSYSIYQKRYKIMQYYSSLILYINLDNDEVNYAKRILDELFNQIHIVGLFLYKSRLSNILDEKSMLKKSFELGQFIEILEKEILYFDKNEQLQLLLEQAQLEYRNITR